MPLMKLWTTFVLISMGKRVGFCVISHVCLGGIYMNQLIA